MRVMGRFISENSTNIRMSGRELLLIKKYRDRQRPEHWENGDAAIVKELLDGLIGPEDPPEDPPTTPTDPTIPEPPK